MRCLRRESTWSFVIFPMQFSSLFKRVLSKHLHFNNKVSWLSDYLDSKKLRLTKHPIPQTFRQANQILEGLGVAMKPYTRSIIELFDGKKRYLIPLYQRQYAWNVEPQLILLWEDICRAYERLIEDRASMTPHFMGAMVIAQIKTFGKEVQAFEVIDGQQRLTTFQLLLAALRDVAKANGST